MPTKLSAESEKDVLRLLDTGLRINVLATRFGVGGSTIRRIRNRNRPTSARVSSQKVRYHRKIGPLQRQWLWHLWDLRAKRATSLEKLAREFRTSVEEIQEAIAARKQLCPTPYSHFRNESESEP